MRMRSCANNMRFERSGTRSLNFVRATFFFIFAVIIIIIIIIIIAVVVVVGRQDGDVPSSGFNCFPRDVN